MQKYEANLNLINRLQLLEKLKTTQIVNIESSRVAANSYLLGTVLLRLDFLDGTKNCAHIKEDTNLSTRREIFRKLNTHYISQIDWCKVASVDINDVHRNAWQENNIFIRLEFNDGSVKIVELE